MCQYSAKGGYANDWHFAHLARFAMGGFGTVMVEATAVSPEGRISYGDLGLWEDGQIDNLARIAAFLKSQGAVAAIQLAHAGRKASSVIWWRGTFNETEAEKPEVGFEEWQPVSPSAILHSTGKSGHKMPRELTLDDMAAIKQAFVDAALRSLKAGFDVIEIHMAHGYLLNQFLSPLANLRTDQYGGSRENRMKFPLAVVEAIRAVWPHDKPLFGRISATDGIDGGWTLDDSVVLARKLRELGMDMLTCSAGGQEGASFNAEPGYMVSYARHVREGSGMPTVAVGLLTEPAQAEAIIAGGDADMVAIAREALDDPNWAHHARMSLGGVEDPYAEWPVQEGFAVRNKDRSLKIRGFSERDA